MIFYTKDILYTRPQTSKIIKKDGNILEDGLWIFRQKKQEKEQAEGKEKASLQERRGA